MGPATSKRRHNGTTPLSLTAPWVGLKPTSPFHAAGTRNEPPVSVPIAAAASPSATETAAPELEPPGASAGSMLFGGVAVIGFSPSPEKASSVIWVLPRQTSPSSVAPARMAASQSGVRPLSSFDPASVGMPALSILSFQLSATPSRSPRRSPALARSWAAMASARARAGVSLA